MVDRVRALKIEESGSGTEDDYMPTEADPTEDFLDSAGVTFNRVGTDDDTVRMERDGVDNMLFRDGVTGPHTLSDLLGGGGGGDGLERAIITTLGGLVYDSAGIIQIKVDP